MHKFIKTLVALSIFVLSACGGGGDSDDFARIKFLHVSPGTGAIDFVVDGVTVATLAYGTGSPYINFNPGSHKVDLVQAGGGAVLNTVTATFDEAVEYSLLAANRAANIEPLILTDENIDPDTDNARFRNINASPTAGAVDFYVLKSDSEGVLASTPTAAGLTYSQVSSYTQRDDGTYIITVTPAGSKTTLAQSAATNLGEGENFSFYLIDSAGGGAPRSVLVVKDED